MNSVPGDDASVLLVDSVSASALMRNVPRVLLLGSYLGYANFGDIAQLKGVIEWYRHHTDLQPVVVLATDSLRDGGDAERARSAFNVDAVVYVAPWAADYTWAGLTPVSEVHSIELLHLYGGGFLNRYWGTTVLSMLEFVQDAFEIERTVISGQQVDPEFAGELADFLRRRPAVLVGCRDEESLEVLRSHGVDAHYSFDDAWETLLEFADTHRSDLVGDGSVPMALVHLNVSAYTLAQDIGSAAGVDVELQRVRDRLSLVVAHVEARAGSIRLLQAYTDRRLLDITDTLGVVVQLEERSSVDSFDVVRLDQMMLRFRPTGSVPSVARAVSAEIVALSSSYHVVLLCHVLGVPSWLMTRNDYYAQKYAGLHLANIDLEEFLRSPAVPEIESFVTARSAWMDQLRLHVSGYRPVAGRLRSLPTPDLSGDIGKGKELSLEVAKKRFEVNDEALQWERQQHHNWKQAAEERGRMIEDLRAWIDNREALIAELQGQLAAQR